MSCHLTSLILIKFKNQKSKIKNQNLIIQISWSIFSWSILFYVSVSIFSSSSVSRIHFLMTILLMIKNLINCFISILILNKIFMLIDSISCLMRWISKAWCVHLINKCFEVCWNCIVLCIFHYGKFLDFFIWSRFFEMIENIHVQILIAWW